MKAIKIILSILIFVAIIPCMICSYGFLLDVETSTENICDNWPTGVSLVDVYDTLMDVETAMTILLWLTFIFFVSAGVLMLAMQKKHYAGFISGGLISLCIIWFGICDIVMNALPNDPSVALAILSAELSLGWNSRPFPAQYNNAVNHYLLFCIIPAVGFLAIAIFETIRHRKNKLNDSADIAVDLESAITDNNIHIENEDIDVIKKYKELYDAGVITQDEFDAKKKQFLGL